MHLKAKAVEVTLSNGEIVMVHEPRMADLGTFLRALPALTAISKASGAAQATEDGILGVPADIPDSALEGIFPLFAVMTDITVADFKDLPLYDGMAVLAAFSAFVPKNLTAATPEPTN